MSTLTTLTTLAQSCTLAELVRCGELTDEHRHLIATLLDEIGTSARISAQTLQRYPDTPEYVATVWTPVGTAVHPAPRCGAPGVRPVARHSARDGRSRLGG